MPEIRPGVRPVRPPQVSTAWLTYRRNGESVRVDLDRAKVVFGRSSNCDVLLALKGVSRAHYVIEHNDDGWFISDLNSTNGTYVNHESVTRRRLEDGDNITLGPPGLVPLIMTYHEQELDVEESPSVGFQEDEGQSPHVRASINLDEQLPDLGEAGRLARRIFGPGSEGFRGGREGSWPVSFFTQVGRLLLSSDDVDAMLKRVLDLAFEYLPVERGSIWLTHETAGSISVRAMRNTIDPPDSRVSISRSIVNAAVRAKQSVLVADAGHDVRFAGAQSIDQMHIRSAMCAPLYHDGRVRGFIYVDSRSHWMSFTEQHLEVLTALAIFTAVGIEFQSRREHREHVAQ